ncbi:hypothetical protein [Acinetobacter kanungonis]|uniref:hypothetical protein n=1 Tax=Acinetobacter kanungonis TaxID=2699469 RepID=UPI00137AC784|nr:hypothetical protein [Acinetobacter kanungonis]NCI77284.1 hypothetical protein [Acinetobacter kanungonis]
MSFWNKLNKFTSDINLVVKKLEQKTAELDQKTAQFCEKERVNDFYKIKNDLVGLNEKRIEVGLKEITIFDFFKDRPEYEDLLEKERKEHCQDI